MDKNTVKDVLSLVFKYGYATDTHLNIVQFLYDVGIPRSEYENWNQTRR